MKRKSRQAGFTLVELLTVMVIIALLAAITLGVAGFANRKSAESKAIADMETIRTALEEYRVSEGEYPEDADWKTAVVDADVVSPELVTEIRAIAFSDPWGQDYIYHRSAKFQYRLLTRGQDGLCSADKGGKAENDADNIDSSKGY